MVVAAFMAAEGDSTAAVEASMAAEVDSVEGPLAGGTMLTAVAFVAELRRAWVARTEGRAALTRLARMAVLHSVAG